MTPASDIYDVVVIGAGAGGMTAAAVAAAEGLSVLLIEKTEFVGGTTAWSGGMVWIPVNAQMNGQAWLIARPMPRLSRRTFLNQTMPTCGKPSFARPGGVAVSGSEYRSPSCSP